MSSEGATQRWSIQLVDVETRRRVGIHPQEKELQRLLVSASVEGIYPAFPTQLTQCFNYEPLYHLVTHEWPKKEHVDLLETCVAELLTFIFTRDRQVQFARVSVRKPDIFPHARSVGVEAEWTRADFERFVEVVPVTSAQPS